MDSKGRSIAEKRKFDLSKQFSPVDSITYLSRYCKTPIPGAFMAWNFVSWPGSTRAWGAFVKTNLSRTVARTRTKAIPSAVCWGVVSILVSDIIMPMNGKFRQIYTSFPDAIFSLLTVSCLSLLVGYGGC